MDFTTNRLLICGWMRPGTPHSSVESLHFRRTAKLTRGNSPVTHRVHRSAAPFTCSCHGNARAYIYSLPRPLQAPTSFFQTHHITHKSSSSQSSYNIQPPTPPKPFNNHPIPPNSKPKPTPKAWHPTPSPTTTANSSPPPGSASKPNPRYATHFH